MRCWKQGDRDLAGQESCDYFDVGIRGIYSSLALCTAELKQQARLIMFFAKSFFL